MTEDQSSGVQPATELLQQATQLAEREEHQQAIVLFEQLVQRDGQSDDDQVLEQVARAQFRMALSVEAVGGDDVPIYAQLIDRFA